MFFTKRPERLSIKRRHIYTIEEVRDGLPYVDYAICYGKKVVGGIELILVDNEASYYYGHIGYHIDKKYRGHHFARSACILVMQEAARDFDMHEFIITCSPDNTASIRTIEGLPKWSFIEKVEVPVDHPLFWRGEREKLVYRVSL